MPRRIHYETEPDPAFNEQRDNPPDSFKDIVLSIVEFSPSENEEIFLSYSTGLEHGPGIKRGGDMAPSMRRFWDIENPWAETTDPDEQRIGTWFIDEDCGQQEQQELQSYEEELTKLRESNSEDSVRMEKLRRKIIVLKMTCDLANQGLIHDKQFKDLYQGYQIIGQQGCSDLTMNQWYVAYVCSSFTNKRKKLIWLYEEPITVRTYTCLVKWKEPYRVTIEEDVKFVPLPDDAGRVQINGRFVEEEIEFAVFGKQVIREGQLVDFRSVAHQFADVRHLIQLPNINPATELYPGDPAPVESTSGRRIRYYYGQEWKNDVWLSEKQLLEDWNLQRAALVGPVVLNRLYGGMGASLRQIGGIKQEGDRFVGGAMQKTGYQPAKDPRRLGEGEWQFVPWDSNLVEVYLQHNRYPWNMIGVDKNAKGIFCLACNGHQSRTGYTVEEAANTFIRATKKLGIELKSALLMDEGNDVFQKVLLDDKLQTTVPLRRRQARAKFIFAKKGE